MAELKAYAVWDAPTRWFHWINVVAVIALVAVGVVILNAGALGIPNPGKVALKTLHVWIGYVFAVNLGWRLVWAFAGNRYARWRQMLPGGPGYLQELRGFIAARRSGGAAHYLGHNPVGRISVALLLLLLTVQAVTGLLLAGTDLFYPPLGHWFAQLIAAPGVDPSTLVPYTPELYDKAAFDRMRALRKPFATVHVYGFYTLLVLAALHIAAVVHAELRDGGSLISAMFSGRKILSGTPVDAPARTPRR